MNLSLKIGGTLAVLLLFSVLKVFYNLFLHPLRKIPGPKLAAATRWWLFNREIQHDAHATFMKLHQKYGPLVRISPDEVSVCDAGAFAEIYSQTSKFTKAKYFYNAFVDQAENLFTMCNRSEHLQDKRLMSAAFSQATVLQQEDEIYDMADRLLGRFATLSNEKKSIPLLNALHCMTLDLICKFVFGEAPGSLALANFKSPIVAEICFANAAIAFLQQFPMVREILRWTTYYDIKAIPNPFMGMGKAAAKGLEAMRAPGNDQWSLFSAMVSNATKNSVPLSDERLVAEGILMLVAGTDTTAISLATTTHGLVKRPDLFEKLRNEVMTVVSGPDGRPKFSELDALPFLDACVKEGLRLSSPVRGRLPREVPAGGWSFNGTFFKAGTIVSSTPLFLLHDEDIFPSPDSFDPNRWLGLDDQRSEKMKYFFPFSRGTRQCIGQNLSLIEQKITLAMLVRRFNPVNVTKEIIEWSEVGTNAVPDTPLYVQLECR